MTTQTDVLLSAILDGMTFMQQQIEAMQHRLDSIDAAQASVTDLQPVLETMIATIEGDRKASMDNLSKIADLVARTHASANGVKAPLPVDALSDPMLERFLIAHPATDQVEHGKAIGRWKQMAGRATDGQLFVILENQYQPSPTETAETRVLRLQLAAITREELTKREVRLPDAPASSATVDQSRLALQQRAQKLAELWRAGDTPHLYAEAELVGAVDLFAQLQAKGLDPQAGADAYTKIGVRLANGERVEPLTKEPFQPFSQQRPNQIDRDR